MDSTLDIIIKIIAALTPVLGGVVGALWHALNLAVQRNQDLQAANVVRSDAQADRCRVCNDEWQAEYKELLTTNVEVIRQNTAAQETAQRFSRLMEKLGDVKKRADRAGS